MIIIIIIIIISSSINWSHIHSSLSAHHTDKHRK